MKTESHVRGRVKAGDRIRLYGFKGIFVVSVTTNDLYDFHATHESGPDWPALDDSVVEINGVPVPMLSCPIAPPASDYPHIPLFDYSDGPQAFGKAAVETWGKA